MAERIRKATLSQSQGRQGWSVIFRHPVLIDRTTGKPGRRVRRGLGTQDEKIARRLVAELNELLEDKLFWQPSSRARARNRFSSLVVDIFYHDMVPDKLDRVGHAHRRVTESLNFGPLANARGFFLELCFVKLDVFHEV